MRKTLLKLSMVAITALGATTLGISSAQAAIFFPTDPNVISPDPAPGQGVVCDFTKAVACSEVIRGAGVNDTAARLNTFLTELKATGGAFAGITPSNWGNARLLDDFGNPNTAFLAKVEAPSTTPTEGFIGINPILSIIYDAQRRSGTWEVNVNRTGLTPFVLSMKAGNNVAFNYFDGNNIDDFFGIWDTSVLGNVSLSHVSLWVPNDLVGVPTPALLPGLIGMGIAALRKKNKEEAEADA